MIKIYGFQAQYFLSVDKSMSVKIFYILKTMVYLKFQQMEKLFYKNLFHILIENGYKHLLFGHQEFKSDPIHLNDIQPVLKIQIF